jgi:hypothetical protein
MNVFINSYNYSYQIMESNIHVGKLLQDYFKENKVSKAALSRSLGINAANLEARIKKTSFRTDTLLKISRLLEHNFFADIGAQLPDEFPTNKPVDTTKEELIAALQLEIKILERERDMLGNLIGSRIK